MRGLDGMMKKKKKNKLVSRVDETLHISVVARYL